MFNIDAITKMAEKHHYFFDQLKMIHIAGTNGKGSTSWLVYNVLSTKYKVGIYTSPYDQFRFDNIKINDDEISETDVSHLLSFYDHDFKTFGLSEFEIDTWIALAWFYQNQCDYAIIEVGLGGILDATNIITPIITAITNIGYDHQDVLGKNILEITQAKAGIIKKNIPLIVGPTLSGDILKVILNQADLKEVQTIQAKYPKDVSINQYMHLSYKKNRYQIHTKAFYQKDNIALVLEIFDVMNQYEHIITKEMIEMGFKKTLMHKRFEIMSDYPRIIFDGAHNLEGVVALVKSLKKCKYQENLVVFIGVLKDKPYEKMIKALKTLTSHIYLVKFDHDRALDSNQVEIEGIIKLDSIDEIKRIITNPDHQYLCTGSLYFLRAIHQMIKEFIHEK